MSLNTDNRRVPPITRGIRLRIAREWRGLSQDDLAEVLGKTRQTISNYEREFTPIGKLEVNAWAVSTDTDVEWLKTGQENPTPGGSERRNTDYGGHITDITTRLAA